MTRTLDANRQALQFAKDNDDKTILFYFDREETMRHAWASLLHVVWDYFSESEVRFTKTAHKIVFSNGSQIVFTSIEENLLSMRPDKIFLSILDPFDIDTLSWIYARLAPQYLKDELAPRNFTPYEMKWAPYHAGEANLSREEIDGLKKAMHQAQLDGMAASFSLGNWPKPEEIPHQSPAEIDEELAKIRKWVIDNKDSIPMTEEDDE